MSQAASEQWSRTLEGWSVTRANALWRAHSDAVNLALIRRRLPDQRLGRVLKTDLFDEAVGQGLIGELQVRAEEVVGIDLAPPVAGNQVRSSTPSASISSPKTPGPASRWWTIASSCIQGDPSAGPRCTLATTTAGGARARRAGPG